jgi:hypothetical protein
MLGKFYTAPAWPDSKLLFAPGGLAGLGGLVCLRRLLVLALEALHSPRRVDKLLFAREKGMAARANLHAHEIRFIRRARFEGAAAGAMNGNFMIIGMNTGFHVGSFRKPFCTANNEREYSRVAKLAENL